MTKVQAKNSLCTVQIVFNVELEPGAGTLEPSHICGGDARRCVRSLPFKRLFPLVHFRCGNGLRERMRQHQLPGRCAELRDFRCRHATREQQWCNLGCPHGGAPSEAGCTCPPGYHGVCCQFGECRGVQGCRGGPDQTLTHEVLGVI